MVVNLVMLYIARGLEMMKHLKHTVYADDITIWTDGLTEVQTATAVVQRGLDATERGSWLQP